MTEQEIRIQELENFVQLVAIGKRPDGTYNYCREALEFKAKEILKPKRAGISFDELRSITPFKQ